jgi:hypothetical protein
MDALNEVELLALYPQATEKVFMLAAILDDIGPAQEAAPSF